MPWKILGHIPIAAECEAHFPAKTHPHAYAHYIRKKYNLGKVFYVDFWPLGPRNLFIADPEIASQYITTTQSLPKSPLVSDYLHKLLGPNNMVSLEGPKWKALRSMFNPGFASAHLMTLVPYIVDQSLVFCDVLRESAASNTLIEMEELATRLTVDIIGKVVLDSDFNAQRSENPIVSTFRRQVELMPPTSINPLLGLDPLRNFNTWVNGRKLDRLIGEELDRKFSASKQNGNGSAEKVSRKDRKRSVVDLALEAYQKESTNGTKTRSGVMDANFRQNSIDSIKTFIFAGHDTTSSTIACVFYLLHGHSACHEKVIAELTSIFGTLDSSSIASQIRSTPHLINKLDYTTAVIKETLRLFPPASTLRDIGDQDFPGITDPDTGEIFPMKGYTIWPIVHLIHRNEEFFPRPTEFIPERFLQDSTPFPDAALFTTRGKDAWRPFEKGPRNCVGQELAMIETKVILAMTLGVFDFVAEFDGREVKEESSCESVDERMPAKGRVETVEGRRVYQVLKGSAKPVGGMPGRVKLR
jgi:cytochrome P450